MEKLLETDKDVEQFLFWIGTLQARAFKKAKGILQIDNTYCCLGIGVACLVCENEMIKDQDCELTGGMPTDQPYAPKWLKLLNEYCIERFRFSIAINNDNDMSHPQIANFLLKKFEQGLL